MKSLHQSFGLDFMEWVFSQSHDMCLSVCGMYGQNTYGILAMLQCSWKPLFQLGKSTGQEFVETIGHSPCLIIGRFSVIPTTVCDLVCSWGLISVWISNHRHFNVWYEITYPFSNFNGATPEISEWISNFMPTLLYMWLFIHACIKVKTMLEKREPVGKFRKQQKISSSEIRLLLIVSLPVIAGNSIAILLRCLSNLI